MNDKEPQYIDLTPTWLATLPTLVVLYNNGQRSELERMAKIADAHVAAKRASVERT